MSLKEILEVVEKLIDAALGSGLIKDHNTAKGVMATHTALSEKAAAETAAAGAPALKIADSE